MSAAPPPALRPLNIADILDLAIRLYRQNLGPFLGIIAIVYTPVGVTQIAAAYVMGSVSQTMPDNPQQIPWAQFGVMGLAVLSMVLVSLLAVPLGQGALTIAVSRRYLNEPVTVADAYHSIGGRWGVLIATVMLVGMAVTTGTLFCVIPGVYLGVIWMFAAPIIAIEGRGPIEAMKRSMALVEGEWWRCFGTYMLLSLLTGLITSAASWPITIVTTLTLMEKNMALAQAINQGVGVAISVQIQPVLITGLVLLYYDLRVRKEGFDLELLARAMGSGTPCRRSLRCHCMPHRRPRTTLLPRLPRWPPQRPPPRTPPYCPTTSTTTSNHEHEAPMTAPKDPSAKAVLFTDGASKGNPGPAGAGFVLEFGTARIDKAIPLGVTTVGVAEYRALIAGLTEATVCGIKCIEVFTDSEFMARQMLGIYKVRTPAIRPLYDRACKLRDGFEKFRIQHVPRELNNLADGLATDGAKASAQGERVDLED